MSQRDPFANFERMRRQIDELFGDFWDARRALAAPARRSARASTSTTAATRREAVIKADLAGVGIDDVNLEVRGPHARDPRRAPAARRRGPRLPADRDRARARSSARSSSASTSIAEQARATYDDGILRVELPVADAPRGATRSRSRRRDERRARPTRDRSRSSRAPAEAGDDASSTPSTPARRAAGPAAEGDGRLPEHDDAAGRRPGALGAARERRARRATGCS